MRSILAQDDQDFRLIIHDDCSLDDTVAIVRREVGFRAEVTVHEKRLGLAGNWNACAKRSTTPWTAIFHQDDVMLTGHVREHLQAIAEHPDAGMIVSAAEAIDDEGRPIAVGLIEAGGLGGSNRRFEAGELVERLATSNPLRCSAITLRTEALAAVGGFDPSYRYVLDWEAWLRIARRYPVIWRSEPTVRFRWHEGSETRRFERGVVDLEETERLLQKIWSQDASLLKDLGRVRKEGNRRLARAYLNRAYQAARSNQRRLCRDCTRKAIALNPSVVACMAGDFRLWMRLAKGFWSGRRRDSNE